MRDIPLLAVVHGSYNGSRTRYACVPNDAALQEELTAERARANGLAAEVEQLRRERQPFSAQEAISNRYRAERDMVSYN
jgi:hypothetical protein